MGEKQTKPLTIDGVEYDTNTFTPEQIVLTNHCLDLDRKIASTKFQLQQLEVGKNAFIQILKTALETKNDSPQLTQEQAESQVPKEKEE
jgi:hypothetical protein